MYQMSQLRKGIDFEIEAQSEDGDRKKLEEIIKLAEERCPAVYSMSHVIKVNARIK